MTNPESSAADYLRRGWSIIPIEPSGKRPLLSWQAFQSRHATLAELHEWYRRWPEANVGVVTGAVSGLVVLDIDMKHQGFESLPALERCFGPLPRTVEAMTGGGGRHCYFRHPGVLVRNRVGIFPGIDLRGDGGCVVAPPSMHSSGRRYEWVIGHSPGEIVLAQLPARLLDRVRTHRGHTLGQWRDLARTGVVEGKRNNTIASLAGHLLHRGIDQEVTLELLLAWNRMRCRPPLSDAEVAGVVASIAKLHQESIE